MRCALRTLPALATVIAALLFVFLPLVAPGAELTIPASTTVVVDGAQVLDAAAAQRITDLLVQLRARTTAEVKVLTVASSGGEDIVTFAQRHYDQWKLGKSGKDNGALIVLAVAERHVRIHTGYGLEPVLPDSWCGSLSRSVAQDYFKAGKYGAGIERMAQAVAAEVAAAQGVTLDQGTAPRYQPGSDGAVGQSQGGSPWLIVIIIIVVVILMMRRARSGITPWGGSYGGFGGGGGGGGGGSFGGGFSGGGGRSGGGGGGASW
ncbi:MAG: TPM domain-containing protein [Planctomycetes bacterium]|nr:TPM domain-containing protein [Planctomycetota bacterium]